jgi:hypothetical protein
LSEVVRILITAGIAAPVLLIATMIEVMVTDDGIFSKVLGLDILVIIGCLGILAFQYLMVLWG